MATVKTVTATINGTAYTLTYNSISGKYEATITAPTTTSYNVNSGHYYPVTVKATDTADNTATADDSSTTLGESLKLRVKETTKPVITISSPGSGATLTSNAPTITFDVTDSGSGVNKSAVKLKVDGAAVTLGTPTVIANGFRYTYAASGLTDGSHTIAIDASDYDGNAAAQASRTFKVDTVPPTLNVTSPANASATNNKSCTISGTTNDVTSSPVEISITVNGAAITAPTVGSNGTFSASCNLTEGTNTIVITARDSAGKTTSITRTVELDTSAPVISAVTLTPNPVNTGATYTITVEVN